MGQRSVELAQVVSSAAHDLRSPLNAITGFSRLLLNGIDGPLSEVQSADVQAIHTSGQEMLRLVDCLIDLAKVQTGQWAPSPSAVHLDALLDKVIVLHTGTGAQPAPAIGYAAAELPQALWVDAAILQRGLERLLAGLLCLVPAGRVEIGAQIEGTNAVVRFDTVAEGGLSPQASRVLQAYEAAGRSADHRVDVAALHLIAAQQLLTLQGATIEIETASPGKVTARATLPLGASRTGPELDP
jgi:K+-sensing histidine kinase KdpD